MTLKEQKFFHDVNEAANGKYEKQMIDEFCDYWTEPNKSKTKLRWEGEKYFDIKRRLATWDRRRKQEFEKTKGITVKAEVVSTGAYDKLMKDTLKFVYNDQRDGLYVKLHHGKGDSVYNFLESKGVIKTKNLTLKGKTYFSKRSQIAQGMVLARIIDELKKAEGERKEQLETRARSVKKGTDADLWPQVKALILTDVFNKYTLEQLLEKL